MLILTDCPNELSHALPVEPSWSVVNVASLALGDRSLWSAVSSSPIAHQWDAGERLRIGGIQRMVVIDHAPASQFTSLMDTLATGAVVPDGSALLALQGTGFKGQRGRAWSAMKGNIHACVYYHAEVTVDRLGMGLTMLPAVAVIDAIRDACGSGLHAGIKWVNDILIDGSKVAGVLTATHAHGRSIEHVVLGIGVNVNVAPPIQATPFVPHAGCLKDFAETDWPSVFLSLLQSVDRHYRNLLDAGPGDLLRRYRDHSVVVGESVRIWHEQGDDVVLRPPIAGGVVEAIEEDLSLVLRGQPEPVCKGRLAFEAACRRFGCPEGL